MKTNPNSTSSPKHQPPPVVFPDLHRFTKHATRTLVVRDLPYSCKNEHLHQFFQCELNFPVELVHVCFDRKQQSLHYGYVMFPDEVTAQTALHKVQGMRFWGRDLRLQPFDPLTPSQTSISGVIHVFFRAQTNQMPLITEETLRNFLETFGEIEHIVIRSHEFDKHDQRQNGFGFVTFKNPEINHLVSNTIRARQFHQVTYDCSWSKRHDPQQMSSKLNANVTKVIPTVGLMGSPLSTGCTTLSSSPTSSSIINNNIVQNYNKMNNNASTSAPLTNMVSNMHFNNVNNPTSNIGNNNAPNNHFHAMSYPNNSPMHHRNGSGLYGSASLAPPPLPLPQTVIPQYAGNSPNNAVNYSQYVSTVNPTSGMYHASHPAHTVSHMSLLQQQSHPTHTFPQSTVFVSQGTNQQHINAQQLAAYPTYPTMYPTHIYPPQAMYVYPTFA